MLETTKHSQPKIGSDKGFGLVFAAVFALIAAWPLLDGGAIRWWSVGVACLFVLVAFAWPSLLRPLNKVWFFVGECLGKVIAPIFMGLMFFGIFTPGSYLVRILGVKLMSNRASGNADSYWIKRDDADDRATSMRNQF